MSVAVKDGIHAKTINRLFQPGGTKKRKNFRIFALNRCPNRRVMKNGNFFFGFQFRERLFETDGVIDCFFDELLDQRFAPRIQHAPAKTPAKPANTGEANPADFGAFAIQHGTPARSRTLRTRSACPDSKS